MAKRRILSASQYATMTLCPRKWALQKILKLEVLPHPSAELGSDTHHLLERYLKHAEPPDPREGKAAALAAALVPLLPEPQIVRTTISWTGDGTSRDTSLAPFVERRFSLSTDHFSWIGYVDLFLPGEVPIVIDHKTSSNIKRYAKTAETLLESDPQAALYALAAEMWSPNPVSEVELRWQYVQTGGGTGRGFGKTLRVKHPDGSPVLMRVADAIARVRAMDARAHEILSVGTEPEDIEKYSQKRSACSAFGGCPFQSRCWPQPKQKIVQITRKPMTQERKNAFLGQLRQRLGGSAEPANDNINPPEKPKHRSAADVHAASRQAFAKIPGLPEVIPTEVAAAWDGGARDLVCVWLGEVLSAPDEDSLAALFGENTLPLQVETWLQSETGEPKQEEPPPSEPKQEEPPKPKRRGRKPKVKEPEPDTPPTEEIAGAIEGDVVKRIVDTVSGLASEVAGLVDRGDGAMVEAGIGVLFIDCAPEGEWGFSGRPVACEDILDSLEPVGQDDDGNDVPYYSLVPFGRGRAFAEHAIKEHLAVRGYASATIRSDSPVGRDLLHVFRRHARRVVRGFGR